MHKFGIVAGPARQPVCAPTGREGRVEKGEADCTCGINLFDMRDLFGGFGAGHNSDGKIRVAKLGDGLVDLLGLDVEFCPAGRDGLRQPAEGWFFQDCLL